MVIKPKTISGILVLKQLREQHDDLPQLEVHRQAQTEVFRDSSYESDRKLQATMHDAVGIFSLHWNNS